MLTLPSVSKSFNLSSSIGIIGGNDFFPSQYVINYKVLEPPKVIGLPFLKKIRVGYP
jgi:hypothetical protein